MTSTHEPSLETVLKAGPKRTVLHIACESGPGRVVKRFHSPGLGGLGLLGAPGDRRRAMAEWKGLQRAHAAGLPVPMPMGVSRGPAGHWELSMAALEGARPLSDALNVTFGPRPAGPPDAEPAPEPLVDVARCVDALAALLRQVDATGFLHADPHPSNLMLDEQGRVWIVDVARSRLGAPAAQVRRSIERALSRMRELAPRSFRRRIARAWLGERATNTWTRVTEARATRMRIDEMRDRVSVWRRTSSATEVRPGLDGRGTAVWVRARGAAAPDGWKTVRDHGSSQATGRAWSTLVRAKLHGIPCAEPRALALGPPHAVEYDVPEVEEPPSAEAIAHACRRLALSGLDAVPASPVGSAGHWIADGEGRALVGPAADLIERQQPPVERP